MDIRYLTFGETWPEIVRDKKKIYSILVALEEQMKRKE